MEEDTKAQREGATHGTRRETPGPRPADPLVGHLRRSIPPVGSPVSGVTVDGANRLPEPHPVGTTAPTKPLPVHSQPLAPSSHPTLAEPLLLARRACREQICSLPTPHTMTPQGPRLGKPALHSSSTRTKSQDQHRTLVREPRAPGVQAIWAPPTHPHLQALGQLSHRRVGSVQQVTDTET